MILLSVNAMAFKAALRFGADPLVIEQAELYAAIAFAVIYFVGVLTHAWAIYKHETAHAAANSKLEYLKHWSGCQWEADVGADGTVGTPRTIPGGITDFSDARQQQQGGAPREAAAAVNPVHSSD